MNENGFSIIVWFTGNGLRVDIKRKKNGNVREK